MENLPEESNINPVIDPEGNSKVFTVDRNDALENEQEIDFDRLIKQSSQKMKRRKTKKKTRKFNCNQCGFCSICYRNTLHLDSSQDVDQGNQIVVEADKKVQKRKCTLNELPKYVEKDREDILDTVEPSKQRKTIKHNTDPEGIINFTYYMTCTFA